jgi:hypothetical protein
MAKRNPVGTGGQVKNKSDAEPSIQAISLIIGAWKGLFPEEQNKIIIAEALNYYSCSEGLIIIGYLITNRRVCLVLETDKGNMDKMLTLFYEGLKRAVQQYHDRLIALDMRTYNSKGEIKKEGLFASMFVQRPLVNDYLIRLITGREVNLPYYNPHLARLKDRLHNYNFCSVIDYSGAKGPVIVKLLEKEESFNVNPGELKIGQTGI